MRSDFVLKNMSVNRNKNVWQEVGCQGFIRPAVVVSADASNHCRAPQVTVCPLSSKLKDNKVHLYKVPNTSKYVQKKYVRIGEGSITYSIGHHRFIEMARAAGAVYKINEGTGGTVLINIDIFDEYMEQFREEAIPMKHPLFGPAKGE